MAGCVVCGIPPLRYPGVQIQNQSGTIGVSIPEIGPGLVKIDLVIHFLMIDKRQYQCLPTLQRAASIIEYASGREAGKGLVIVVKSETKRWLRWGFAVFEGANLSSEPKEKAVGTDNQDDQAEPCRSHLSPLDCDMRENLVKVHDPAENQGDSDIEQNDQTQDCEGEQDQTRENSPDEKSSHGVGPLV